MKDTLCRFDLDYKSMYQIQYCTHQAHFDRLFVLNKKNSQMNEFKFEQLMTKCFSIVALKMLNDQR